MRTLLVVLALILAPASGSAQVSLGLRAGINGASSTLLDDTAVRFAPAVSVFADVPVGGRLSLRPEAFYSSEGVTTPAQPYTILDTDTGEVTRATTRTGAVQVETVGLAALVSYSVPVGGLTLNAYAGPAVSAKVRERDVFRADFLSARSSDLFARTAVSAVGGASLSRGRVGLDVRVGAGLTDARGGSERVQAGGHARVVTAALVVRPGPPRPGRPGRPSLGMRAGVARAGLSPGLFVAGSARVTPALSVFADVPLRGAFSLRPEAFYSSEGERIGPSEITFENADGQPVTFTSEGGAVQTDHLGAGLFAAATVPVGGLTLGAYAGPAISGKVRERDISRNRGATSEQSSSYFGYVAVSGVGGATVSRGALGLDVRVALSATDALNRASIGGGTVRSQVTSVALVYRFAR